MRSAPSFRKPRALRRGDRVAVIAPAGPFDRASFEAGLAILQRRYSVGFDPTLFDRHRYLAGSDSRRLDELRSALGDPGIRALFCARGGYGTMRLLPQLADAIDSASAADLKPLVGFSDITGLHQWLQQQGVVSVHGPVVTQLGRQPASTCERLFSLLESTAPAAPLEGSSTYVGGAAEGPLIGGNLTMLSQLLGTPFLPPLDGAILLLEDVGERPYRLDRMWTHLALAGVFHRVRGLVLGSFNACEEQDSGYTSAEVLRELAMETGLPCAAGFAIGHSEVNEPVPLGVRVRLDADRHRLEFLEPATA